MKQIKSEYLRNIRISGFRSRFPPETLILILLILSAYSCSTVHQTTFTSANVSGPAPGVSNSASPASSNFSETHPSESGLTERPQMSASLPDTSDPGFSHSRLRKIADDSTLQNFPSNFRYTRVTLSPPSPERPSLPDSSGLSEFVPDIISDSDTYEAVSDIPEADYAAAIFIDSPPGDSYPISDFYDSEFYSTHSEKLGVCLDGWENKTLIREVAEWLGVRYRWGGASKRGIDCSALIQSIYRDVYNIELARTVYAMFKSNKMISVKRSDLQEGDLLFFRTRGKRVSHIGIYLKNNKFVHAIRKKGVIVSDLRKRYYKKRFISGKRVVRMAEYNP